jgi:hypothetical protein
LFLAAGAFASESVFTQFIHRDGDKLMNENGELRFISFNIPCLHYNEDNMAFTEMNPWRLTNEFKITDALEAVRQMGGQDGSRFGISGRMDFISDPADFNYDGIVNFRDFLILAGE